MTTPNLSIVVPTYNAEKSICELFERLEVALADRTDSFEVIFVNDGSADRSWAVLEDLAARSEKVVAIDLLTNSGQPIATLAGLSRARGELVCTMDDDLQHPPEQLPVLLDQLEANPGWDAVVGSWTRDSSFFRNLGSKTYSLADRLAWGTPRNFRHTGFRVLRRPALDAIISFGTVNPVIGPLLLQVANEVHNVEVEHADRTHGQSGFSVVDSIRHVGKNFAQGSTLPLKVLSVVGAGTSASSFVLALALLVRWILGSRGPQGWLSTIVLTLFIGGLILLGIGLLGQYIQLIVQEVRRPPRWNVRRTLGGQSD